MAHGFINRYSDFLLNTNPKENITVPIQPENTRNIDHGYAIHAAAVEGTLTLGRSDQAPNEALQSDTIDAIADLLDTKAAWVSDPVTSTGPYGGVSTSVHALIKNDEGVYEGVLVSVYANDRSTTQAIAKLEAKLQQLQTAGYIESVIDVIENPESLKPKAPAAKGGRSK